MELHHFAGRRIDLEGDAELPRDWRVRPRQPSRRRVAAAVIVVAVVEAGRVVLQQHQPEDIERIDVPQSSFEVILPPHHGDRMDLRLRAVIVVGDPGAVEPHRAALEQRDSVAVDVVRVHAGLDEPGIGPELPVGRDLAFQAGRPAAFVVLAGGAGMAALDDGDQLGEREVGDDVEVPVCVGVDVPVEVMEGADEGALGAVDRLPGVVPPGAFRRAGRADDLSAIDIGDVGLDLIADRARPAIGGVAAVAARRVTAADGCGIDDEILRAGGGGEEQREDDEGGSHLNTSRRMAFYASQRSSARLWRAFGGAPEARATPERPRNQRQKLARGDRRLDQKPLHLIAAVAAEEVGLFAELDAFRLYDSIHRPCENGRT